MTRPLQTDALIFVGDVSLELGHVTTAEVAEHLAVSMGAATSVVNALWFRGLVRDVAAVNGAVCMTRAGRSEYVRAKQRAEVTR